jgi:hypothetical protein
MRPLRGALQGTGGEFGQAGVEGEAEGDALELMTEDVTGGTAQDPAVHLGRKTGPTFVAPHEPVERFIRASIEAGHRFVQAAF